jgi:hypothetical protein
MGLREERRELAKNLIKLALDEGATSEERNSTAVRAIKIIRKYKLLDLAPIDGVLDHPAVRAAKTVADKLSDPEFTDGLKELFGQVKSAAGAARQRRRRR